MANLTWKSMALKIDDNTGSLTTVTNWVNSASLEGAMETLEDTSLNDEEHSYLSGLAGATIPINGWVNTTTEGIFGPLVGNRTTATKTVEFYNGVKYYNGEVWVTEVSFSGDAGSLQTFSANCTFDGAVTRTSTSS